MHEEIKREKPEEGGIFGVGKTTSGVSASAQEWKPEDGMTNALVKTINKLPQGQK
jgi:hypothetical protein